MPAKVIYMNVMRSTGKRHMNIDQPARATEVKGVGAQAISTTHLLCTLQGQPTDVFRKR